MRVLSVFVRHGSTRYASALDDLREFHRTRIPSVHHDLLVVDNAPDARETGTSGDPEVVAGSNRFWEFSGWDEGLARVGAKLREYDLVHLVTSAFRTLHVRYIDRIDERMLRLVAARGAALGHIDYYDQPIELLGGRSQCWLRSSFMFIPPAQLAALGSLVGVQDPGLFFSDDPAEPFLPDAPLSATYRRYLIGWLTGPGTGQGTQWHSRFSLDRETLPRFQAKVLAILNEHMLAIRLRGQGCALVDATWLATYARWPWRTALPPSLPDWRDQLARRDTDAVKGPAAAARSSH